AGRACYLSTGLGGRWRGCRSSERAALHIMGGSRMVKRFHLQVMVFIPLAGTNVEFGYALALIPWRGGEALVESLPQQIRKKMMIAVPTPLVVQRDEEQVGVFEIFQGGLPCSSLLSSQRARTVTCR